MSSNNYEHSDESDVRSPFRDEKNESVFPVSRSEGLEQMLAEDFFKKGSKGEKYLGGVSVKETRSFIRDSWKKCKASADENKDFLQEASTEDIQQDDSGESQKSSLVQRSLSSFKSDSTDEGLSAAKPELQSVSYLPENPYQRNDFIRVRPNILEFQKRENWLTFEMTSLANFPLLLKIKSQSRNLRAFPSRSILRVGEILQVQLLKSDDSAAMQWDSYQGPIKDAFGDREKEVVTVRILTTAQPRGCGPPFTLSQYREMWRSTPEENISVKRLDCIIHGSSSPEKDDSTFQADKKRLRSSEGFSTTMVDKGEIGDFTSIQHLLDHVDTRGSLTMLDTSTQTVSSRKSTGPSKWWILVFLLLSLSLLLLILLDINMFWWRHPDEETTFECKSLSLGSAKLSTRKYTLYII